MVEYLDNLSITESEELKRTIKDLFRQTCILQVKIDPVTLIPRDNPRYQLCVRHKEFIQDYLSVLDCEMIHDPQEHLFRITGDGVMTEKMSLTTTLLVLIIKIIYRDKVMGEGLNATVTNMEEIRKYGKDTNLITRKLNVSEVREALTLMKFHQILEIPCAIANVEDDTPFYIYSTINIYCSFADINEMVARYQEEVVQLTMEQPQEKEEDTSETGEEDIY